MSYYTSSYNRHRGGRNRDRGGYYDGRRDRDRRWNSDRGWSSFRRSNFEDDGRKDPHYRSYHRDREVVLIRRDREREEDKKPHISPAPHEGTATTNCIPRSPSRNNPDFQNVDQRMQASLHHGSSVHHHLTNSTISGIPISTISYPPNTIGHASCQLPFAKLETPSVEKPGSSIELNPLQQDTIKKCISNFKTRGDYDRIRRECMLDIDTKPAFINAMGKVADITSKFLQTAQYHPNMDKARMRENLKKSFELSKNYQNGVESLVNQILLPKISSTIRPMVETEIKRALNTDESRSNAYENTKQESQIKVYSASPKNVDMTLRDKQDSGYCPSYLPPIQIILDSITAIDEPCMSTPNSHDHVIGTFEISLNDGGVKIHDAITKELNKRGIEPLQVNRRIEESPPLLERQIPTENSDFSSFKEIANIVVEPKAVELKETSNIVVEPKDSSNSFVGLGETLDIVTESNETSNIAAEAANLLVSIESLNDRDNLTPKFSAKLAETNDVPYLNYVSHEETTNKHQLMTGENKINSLEEGPREQHPIIEYVETCDENNDVELMEEDSEEESPEFEKIGEISPVRIERIPAYEYMSCEDEFTVQTREKENDCSVANATTVITNTQTNSCSDSENIEVNQGDNMKDDSRDKLTCKYLDLAEFALYKIKMEYFNRVKDLSPAQGKTKEIIKN